MNVLEECATSRSHRLVMHIVPVMKTPYDLYGEHLVLTFMYLLFVNTSIQFSFCCFPCLSVAMILPPFYKSLYGSNYVITKKHVTPMQVTIYCLVVS
jgi:hypothetical protein